MDIDSKLRTLYVGKILFDYTDEERFLTTEQIRTILKDEYNMDVHRQTIPRDIKILKDFGMEIEEEHSPNKNRYYLEKRQFEDAEIKLILDAISSSKFISKSMTKKLTAKVAMLAGNSKAADLKRNISVEGKIKTSNEKLLKIIDVINYAINKKLRISFCYATHNEQKKKVLRNTGEPYVFSPYDLVWNGDNYYVVGYSDKHKDIVKFRVDRISGTPAILQDKAEPKPKDYNINERINHMFHMFSADNEKVELFCDNDVMEAIVDRFGEKVDTETIDENTFKATVTVDTSHIFYSWVFGFGGKVKIVGPENVKEKYTDMLITALAVE